MILSAERAIEVCRSANLFIDRLSIKEAANPNEVSEQLNVEFAPFFRTLCPRLHFLFDFEMIGGLPRFHTELAIINLSESRCIFVLPIEWCEASGRDKFVRVMKKLLPIAPVLQRMQSIPIVSFVFEIGDNGYLPSVSYSSLSAYSCLVPDWDFFSSGGYKSFRDYAQSHLTPWATRERKVFWRGQTTGLLRHSAPKEGEPVNFSWLQRAWLCHKTKSPTIRDYCDVGISGITQINDEYLIRLLNDYNLMKEPVAKYDYLNYRFIIDIDGNSNAWSGLFTALLGGGCIIKIRSERDFRQWYYRSLHPFVHYVPVGAEMSDIEQAVDWVLKNDRQAEAIADCGRLIAETVTLEQAVSQASQDLRLWLESSISAGFMASIGR